LKKTTNSDLSFPIEHCDWIIGRIFTCNFTGIYLPVIIGYEIYMHAQVDYRDIITPNRYCRYVVHIELPSSEN